MVVSVDTTVFLFMLMPYYLFARSSFVIAFKPGRNIMMAKLIKYMIERNAITPSIESLLIKKPITTVEKLPMNFPIFMIKLLAVATMSIG